MIARVEPLTTARALRGPFDYLAPDGVEVGSLLVVPFGRQRLLGVVIELAGSSEVAPEKLVAPLEALEQGVPAELVRLAGWMAEAYCSTPARCLQLLLPPGAGRGQRARRALVAELTTAGRDAQPRGERQREALAALQTGPQAVATLPGGAATARRLAEHGWAVVEQRSIRRTPRTSLSTPSRANSATFALSEAQELALARVAAGLSSGGAELLLHGVTGSGKTEVYLRAAEATLAAGRTVIVLVPEIALTPQTVGRFQARFGDTVAVLHSQLGQGERYDEWTRLRSGEARVAVGPRSAVFAPLAGLGLVVVDEEHDSSFKNEGDPRYDARTVAARRAEQAGAVLLAGSATPRPESWHRMERLTLPRRMGGGGKLPPVEVLDMREAKHALHPRTREALDDVRRAGEEKAIVLLNRRGWSNFLSCRACGSVRECPQCDVALVLHRGEGVVACHHCGHREPASQRCPSCGSPSVARHGAGTERVEAELTDALATPGFPVFRLDADSAGARHAIADLLGRFDAAPAGVLVGTQMVAKGHDFPEVTLGVVLDADATLRFPDFRAEERTFALIAQLAGRAGRGPRGGRVLVQTLAADAPSIRFAAGHDTPGFLTEELERREALRYPPHAELVRVVCSSTAPGEALRSAAAVRERIVLDDALILGPAPLFRLRGRERAQVVVKAVVRAPAVREIGAAVAALAGTKAHRDVAFSVDVDPQ